MLRNLYKGWWSFSLKNVVPGTMIIRASPRGKREQNIMRVRGTCFRKGRWSRSQSALGGVSLKVGLRHRRTVRGWWTRGNTPSLAARVIINIIIIVPFWNLRLFLLQPNKIRHLYYSFHCRRRRCQKLLLCKIFVVNERDRVLTLPRVQN